MTSPVGATHSKKRVAAGYGSLPRLVGRGLYWFTRLRCRYQYARHGFIVAVWWPYTIGDHRGNAIWWAIVDETARHEAPNVQDKLQTARGER
jgi:hypothetical protein